MEDKKGCPVLPKVVTGVSNGREIRNSSFLKYNGYRVYNGKVHPQKKKFQSFS
jgi:hypothetical protein